MADDKTIQLTITADASELTAAMDQATNIVKSSAGDISEAMQQAKIAAASLADAQEQLGPAAQAGSEQAKAVLAEYSSALDMAKAKVLELREAQASASTFTTPISTTVSVAESPEKFQELAAAMRNYQMAKQAVTQTSKEYAAASSSDKEANMALAESMAWETEATLRLKAAKASLTVAEKSAISGRLAAGAELRVLEGSTRGNIRAVEAFVSSTLKLGPILQMAFPVFGAIAFGEVVGQGIEKLHEMYKAAQNAATELNNGFANSLASLVSQNTELDIQNDKLQNQIDKLEHKPQNNLKLAIDEDIKEVNTLIDRTDTAINKIGELLKLKGVSLFASIMSSIAHPFGGGVESTSGIAKKSEEVKKQLAVLKDQYEFNMALEDDVNKRKEIADKYKADRDKAINDALKEQVALLKEAEEVNGKVEMHGTDQFGGPIYQVRNTSAQISALKGQIATLTALQKEEAKGDQAASNIGKVKSLEEQERVQRQSESAAKKHQEELIKIQNEGLVQYELVHSKGALQEVDYWEKIVSTAVRGTASYRHADDEYIKALVASTAEIKSIYAERNKVLEENAKRQRETAEIVRSLATDNDLAAGLEKITTYADAAREGLKRDSEANKQWAEAVRQGLEISQQNSYALEEANIQTDLQTGKITALTAARKEATLHAQEYDDAIQRINADEAVLQKTTAPGSAARRAGEQQIENRRAKTEGNHQVQQKQDANAQAQALAAPYIQASRMITNSFDQAINGWLRGTQTFSQAMQSMWQNMAMSAIESLEKIGQKQLETWILSVAQHKVSATEDADIDAKGAAVKGWKAGWDMPFPLSLVAAPALAAEALSGGMSLASFDVGTPYVPRTGIAMIHEGERVLTAPDNKTLMQVIAGGGGRGGDTLNVNHSTNVNGISSDSQLQRALNRNPDHVFSAVAKAARRRGIGG